MKNSLLIKTEIDFFLVNVSLQDLTKNNPITLSGKQKVNGFVCSRKYIDLVVYDVSTVRANICQQEPLQRVIRELKIEANKS